HSNRHGALKSRQTIIRKFCRDGEPLQIRIEPDNPYSKNALGVWVQAPGLIMPGAWYQVGYLPQEDADGVREYLDKGWTLSSHIWKVVGSSRGRTLGLRIDVFLNPPGTPPTAECEPAAIPADVVGPRRRWRWPEMTEGTIYDLKRLGARAIVWGS